MTEKPPDSPRQPDTEQVEEPTFLVVVNHEEQYSIWSADQPLPNGWRATGKRGTQKECLDHIEQVWTDMRPLSLRRAEAAARDSRGPSGDEGT